jgi:hypothetical protein
VNMMRRLLLAAFAFSVLSLTAVPPQPAAACPLICRFVNGHWVCGCG